jgi:membrane protein YdbS with pleckstrin-like domain
MNPISRYESKLALQGIDQRQRFFTLLGMVLVLWIPAAIVIFATKILAISIGAFVLTFLLSLWVWHYCTRYYRSFGYALLADGVWIESGVYWRKAVFVPRVRVQHTEVNHGPIDRKMGLAKLSIHTAGVHSGSITIPGLAEARAHELRDQLLQRKSPALEAAADVAA